MFFHIQVVQTQTAVIMIAQTVITTITTAIERIIILMGFALMMMLPRKAARRPHVRCRP